MTPAFFRSTALLLAITLQWNSNPEPNITYRVYRGNAPGIYSSSFPISGTSAIVQASPGVPHFFAVTAVNPQGMESRFSNEVPFSVSPSPTPTITPTPSPSPTPSATATAFATATFSPTSTPTATASSTVPPSPFPTPTATSTPTVTPTSTPTATAIPSPTPDFALTITPQSQTMIGAGSVSYVVKVTRINGWSGPVTFNVLNLPFGVAIKFSSNPASSKSTLTLTGNACLSPGVYPFTIRGQGCPSREREVNAVLIRQ